MHREAWRAAVHGVAMSRTRLRKIFIEFVTILFYVLVFWPPGMWDLSSPTRDRTCSPCIGSRSLNHGMALEVPVTTLKFLLW